VVSQYRLTGWGELERREDTHDNSIIDTQFEIETQWAKKFG